MSSPKSNARQVALQALYQWQVTEQGLDGLCKQYENDPEAGKFHKAYFVLHLTGVVDNIVEIEAAISEFNSRDSDEIG